MNNDIKKGTDVDKIIRQTSDTETSTEISEQEQAEMTVVLTEEEKRIALEIELRSRLAASELPRVMWMFMDNIEIVNAFERETQEERERTRINEGDISVTRFEISGVSGEGYIDMMAFINYFPVKPKKNDEYEEMDKNLKCALFGELRRPDRYDVFKRGIVVERKDFTYFVQVIEQNSALKKLLPRGLTKLYQDVFADPPYNELFTEQEVENLFGEYVESGKVVIARDQEKIIGFGAAIPLNKRPELCSVLADYVDVDKAWYMSELGVDTDYRRNGIAKSLVEERLREIPANAEVVMRTSVDNLASRALYESLGFELISGCIQNVSQERVSGEVVEDQRLFLVKRGQSK